MKVEVPKPAQEQKNKMKISERTVHLTWRCPSGFPCFMLFCSCAGFGTSTSIFFVPVQVLGLPLPLFCSCACFSILKLQNLHRNKKRKWKFQNLHRNKKNKKMKISERTFHLTWRSPSGFPLFCFFVPVQVLGLPLPFVLFLCSCAGFGTSTSIILFLCMFQHLEAPKPAQEQKMKVEVPKPAQEQKKQKNENLRENFPSDLEISLRISIVLFFCSCAGFGTSTSICFVPVQVLEHRGKQTPVKWKVSQCFFTPMSTKHWQVHTFQSNKHQNRNQIPVSSLISARMHLLKAQRICETKTFKNTGFYSVFLRPNICNKYLQT